MAKLTSNLFINWLTYERPPKGAPLCDFDRICYELRPCDVILIEGRSRVSDMIRTITSSSWSHSALYIGRLHDIENSEIREIARQHCKGNIDAPLIIEGILGEGTVINPLQVYKEDHIRICRPRGLSPKDSQEVINHAVRKLGSGYDVRQIFDLARLLLPWTFLPRKMMSKLFKYAPGQTAKTICSTVIAEAFASVDFPILPLVQQDANKRIELIQRNPKLFTPKDFDYSPYFEIIKYPFINFEAQYRNLPWNKSHYSNDGLVKNTEIPMSPAEAEKLLKDSEKKKHDVESERVIDSVSATADDEAGSLKDIAPSSRELPTKKSTRNKLSTSSKKQLKEDSNIGLDNEKNTEQLTCEEDNLEVDKDVEGVTDDKDTKTEKDKSEKKKSDREMEFNFGSETKKVIDAISVSIFDPLNKPKT